MALTCSCLPSPNDSQADLLRKIATRICQGGGGDGDVTGPDGAVDGNIAIFDGATGTVIEDSGINISEITTGLQSGSQAIGAGVETISVVFPTPMTAVPNIVPGISRPVAEPLITVNIDRASVTVNGFTASLGAVTPSVNYLLTWFAHV